MIATVAACYRNMMNDVRTINNNTTRTLSQDVEVRIL